MNPIFIKFGGSLITDKSQARTPRIKTIERLALELRSGLKKTGNRPVLLGHGSGSFGHVSARQYHTRQGVFDKSGWFGFSRVWYDASSLNRILIDRFAAHQIPAITMPPSAGIIARNQTILTWDLNPLLAAIEAGLIPVVYGDVVFDTKLGGTILSTEELFLYLAKQLKPERVLIVGNEAGVFADFPSNHEIIPEITPQNIETIRSLLKGSAATDVTGGMFSKVMQMLALVQENPSTIVSIFSGSTPGELEKALRGDFPGTTIHHHKTGIQHSSP